MCLELLDFALIIPLIPGKLYGILQDRRIIFLLVAAHRLHFGGDPGGLHGHLNNLLTLEILQPELIGLGFLLLLYWSAGYFVLPVSASLLILVGDVRPVAFVAVILELGLFGLNHVLDIEVDGDGLADPDLLLVGTNRWFLIFLIFPFVVGGGVCGVGVAIVLVQGLEVQHVAVFAGFVLVFVDVLFGAFALQVD